MDLEVLVEKLIPKKVDKIQSNISQTGVQTSIILIKL
jgi:hypothetical protein